MNMLRSKKTGEIFPYHPILAQRPDMEEIQSTETDKQKKSLYYVSDEKCIGKGWVKNRFGRWTRIKP